MPMTSRRVAEENQFAILATPWLLFPFERAIAMQGMGRFLKNSSLFHIKALTNPNPPGPAHHRLYSPYRK